jgi:Seven times multi-haem cytochrome CxxCH/PKD domain
MKRCLGICLVVALAVLLLAAASPASAVTITPEACVNCHTFVTSGIVAQFNEGAMSKNGVTCVSCHGDDHDVITQNGGHVPASTCADCHPQQYAEFTAKDAQNAIVEKHALGWTRMTAAARYAVMPAAERSTMCERCHNIGYVWPDQSIGKCDSCHTRHVFSAAEAKEPEACGTCHMGPDHEQIDMWEKSKHGVVYTTEKERAGGDLSRAPTCVTCHMPLLENGAGQPLVHNVSTNITYGTVAQGAELAGSQLPVPMRTITQADFGTRRAKMLDICGQCHAREGFAAVQLANADQVKMDIDAKLWDPVMRIRGLWYDGLLDPMPADRPPNPAYPAVNGGLVLVLGGQQLYGGTSAIEEMFFQTYKYDHVNTFKGAYHINPDYSHWFGWARVLPDIDTIRGEEARLRKAAGPSDTGLDAFLKTAGFWMSNQRAVVGKTTSFSAYYLREWGDPSPNSFEWYFGDGGYAAPRVDITETQHVYTAPGVYPVQLTVSDTDLVNDAANPRACSAKRTTTLNVTVKNGARVSLAPIKSVVAGRKVSLKAALVTDADAAGSLEYWQKASGGRWLKMYELSTSTKAGVPLLWTYRPVLKRTTSYKVVWNPGGTLDWGATSKTRTVKPL